MQITEMYQPGLQVRLWEPKQGPEAFCSVSWCRPFLPPPATFEQGERGKRGSCLILFDPQQCSSVRPILA